ncbi:hypothetical protein [Endozoicomonas sp. SESOKO1]|uniref:hypothetical protein n=1 Tax=Endozoicomonas sp. SESOKO1 TaxID=2828742 RepID=UPI00214941FF|nr:hypothetical protein [Endozoicomonas sp. SESOKO1]
MMAVIAYPIYPEVAREQLMMYRPFSKAPKVIEDDFFLKSQVVQDAIEKSRKFENAYRLSWPLSAYTLSMENKAKATNAIAVDQPTTLDLYQELLAEQCPLKLVHELLSYNFRQHKQIA